jgi:hypothetical protein
MMATSSDPVPTYPPLDVLKPVADGLWIVDSGPHTVFGLPLPVRMTVLRLRGGDLWLHSPTRFTPALLAELQALGRVRHLVAPDIAHWSYLSEWQRACPGTLTWAAPGLRERAQVKKAGVRLDRDLDDEAPPEWAGELEQVVVRGVGFSEVDFFHAASRILVMTDLVQNLEPDKMPMAMRVFARCTGVSSPGGTPLYLRLALRARRSQAGKAARRLVDWAPERVVFSHGRWFAENGTTELRRALGWLLR